MKKGFAIFFLICAACGIVGGLASINQGGGQVLLRALMPLLLGLYLLDSANKDEQKKEERDRWEQGK